MFRLFLAGAEQPAWRQLLTESGATNVAISFSNLRPRLPKNKPYLIGDRFDDDLCILVDSGGFANNQKGWSQEQHAEYFGLYADFVQTNIERIDYVTEYDVKNEYDMVMNWRTDFWGTIPEEKFIAVWHPQYGLNELEVMAEQYPNVAVIQSHDISSRINSLVARYGTNFHATRTKPEDLKHVRYSSAMSSSWVSPMKFGETHIWDGRQLRRYPKPYKDQRRKQHRNDFENAGFDADKIANDDKNEVARFTVWSWLQLEADLTRRRHSGDDDDNVVDITGGKSRRLTPQTGAKGIGKTVEKPSNRELVKRERRQLIPVMGLQSQNVTNEQGEVTETIQIPTLSGGPIRECSTCYIKGVCPAFEEGAECAFDIPVEIRTRDQFLGSLNTLIAMQMQRVMFSRFVEEKEGGYPDQNVSAEMDRFFRMTKMRKDIEEDPNTFELHIRGKGQPGLMTQLFDRGVGEKAKELPEPLDADDTNKLLGKFIDAKGWENGDKKPN